MSIDHAAVFGEARVTSHEMTAVPAVGATVARSSPRLSSAADTDMHTNMMTCRRAMMLRCFSGLMLIRKISN